MFVRCSFGYCNALTMNNDNALQIPRFVLDQKMHIFYFFKKTFSKPTVWCAFTCALIVVRAQKNYHAPNEFDEYIYGWSLSAFIHKRNAYWNAMKRQRFPQIAIISLIKPLTFVRTAGFHFVLNANKLFIDSVNCHKILCSPQSPNNVIYIFNIVSISSKYILCGIRLSHSNGPIQCVHHFSGNHFKQHFIR